MIGYFYPGLSSFVRGDIDALSETQTVYHQNLNWGRKSALPLNFFRQFYFLLSNLRETKKYIVSFAGYHSFFPVLFARIFRKKVFIVLNGTDSVGIKELNYGSHLKPLIRWFCKYSVKNATELWPVSESLINGENSFTGSKLKYGLAISFPKNHFNYFTIPNGFNFDKWPFNVSAVRTNTVVTVVSSNQQFELKGVDLMLQFAAVASEFNFLVVGMNEPEAFQKQENITFTGKIDQIELSKIFSTSRYYFQLSSFEGFGCSLCEAMLSGCIPIGSDVNEIPKIIGTSGRIVSNKKLDILVTAMEELQKKTEEEFNHLSMHARDQILNNYPISVRVNKMLSRM